MAKLDRIEQTRIESFFGSLAAQRSVAKLDATIAGLELVRDTGITVGGGYFTGYYASYGLMRTAATARSFYATAESFEAINAAADVAAAYQTSANYLNLAAGTGFGVAYTLAVAKNPTEAGLGLAGATGDFAADTRFGQVGVVIGVTKATMDYIEASGLSEAQAIAIAASIHASVDQTRQVVIGRYNQ
ncbi:MAG: hypothetical protein ABI222_06145 [Opitutaceae bacterium]